MYIHAHMIQQVKPVIYYPRAVFSDIDADRVESAPLLVAIPSGQAGNRNRHYRIIRGLYRGSARA